jgi:hypothetical protein
MADTAIALIDFDNVKPHRRSGAADAAANMEAVVSAVAQFTKPRFPDVSELHVRLYGGWVDEDGDDTPDARYIAACLPRFRTTRSRLRIRPHLCVAAAVAPDLRLLGTHLASEKSPHQKMVDVLLATDAVYLSRTHRDAPLVVASDDQDFVPALINVVAGRRPNARLLWLRNTKDGEGRNDAALGELKPAGLLLDVLGL